VIGLDTYGNRSNFDFTVSQDPNGAPTMAVSSNGTTVANGATLNVAYGDTLASLGLQLDVDDPEGEAVAVSVTISNGGNTGIVAGEFETTSLTVPYSLAPSSGTFNTPQGVTHTITLAVQDGYNQTDFEFYVSQSPAPGDAQFSESGNTISYDEAAVGTGRDMGNVDVANMPSATVWISVANTGWQDLTLGTPVLTGNGAAEFVLDLSVYTTTVTPGNSTQFGIYYDAAMIGADSAWVEVTHDGVSLPTPFRFEVKATATAANVPVISATSAPGGEQNVAYAPYSLPVTGGTAPFDFVVVGGALPPGLSMSQAGEVTGTPTEIGTSQFTVQVTDAVGASSSQQLSLDVTIDPKLKLSGDGKSGGGSGCTAAGGASLVWLALLGLLAIPVAARKLRA
jgi:hypothetical protein